jgi:hypothetical protein
MCTIAYLLRLCPLPLSLCTSLIKAEERERNILGINSSMQLDPSATSWVSRVNIESVKEISRVNWRVMKMTYVRDTFEENRVERGIFE